MFTSSVLPVILSSLKINKIRKPQNTATVLTLRSWRTLNCALDLAWQGNKLKQTNKQTNKNNHTSKTEIMSYNALKLKRKMINKEEHQLLKNS